MAIKPASGPTPLAASISASPSASTHTLSFPAQTFAKLAPLPFLHAHLTSSTGARRPSGRTTSESRPPKIHTGSLTYTSGSAVVRTGDTAVVCGIRGEILLTKDVADWRHPETSPHTPDGENNTARRKRRKTEADEIAGLNLLVPNVELSTGCSPAHLPGSPPSDLAQTLSHRVLTLLHTSQLLEAGQLRIWHHPASSSNSLLQPQPSNTPNNPASTIPGGDEGEGVKDTDGALGAKPQIKAYWTLHITLLFLSLDGNPFDAAWGALLAALLDVRLPRAWWDADLENVLCSPLVSESTRLSLNGLPVPLTVGVLSRDDEQGVGGEKEKKREKWCLVDMDGFEEGCVRETVCLVVKGEGEGAEIVRIEKGGGGLIGRGEMRELVGAAGRRWREWKELLDGIRGDGNGDTEMG
ncbi:MAG: hypothetical protein Q9195_002665 [Heterodermia aff. obscurata]